MSKFHSEDFPNSQNALIDLGLGFLSPDMAGGDSRLLRDLCKLLLSVLRSPPGSATPAPRRRRRATGAAVLLGASMALVACGSVTFVIGMMMMPWVIGLLVFCYFVGIVSGLKGSGKAVFCSCSSSSSSRMSPKEASSGKSSPKYQLLT